MDMNEFWNVFIAFKKVKAVKNTCANATHISISFVSNTGHLPSFMLNNLLNGASSPKCHSEKHWSMAMPKNTNVIT